MHWFRTDLFNEEFVEGLQASLEEVYGRLAPDVAKGSLSLEDAVQRVSLEVGTSFGMKNGCRSSFSVEFAKAVTSVLPLFDDSEKIDEEEMPDILRESFTGDICTASKQWFAFLSKINESQDEPKSEAYLQDTSNILSMLMIYAQRFKEVVPLGGGGSPD